MIQNNKNLISLNELANQLNLNKSKLSYYVNLDLIHPITIVGRMQIFNKKETIKKLQEISKLQNKDKTLKQIRQRLNSGE